MNTTNYIFPSITLFNNFTDYFKSNKHQDRSVWYAYTNADITDFEDFKKFNKLFIIGEPGYGKSTLVKKINERFEGSTNVALIDIKRHINEILDANSLIDIYNSILSEDIVDSNKELLLLFDALDEVNYKLQTDFINWLRQIKLLENEGCYVTSRTHHILKDKVLLKELEYKVCVLNPFDKVRAFDLIRSDVKKEELHSKIEKRISELKLLDNRNSVLKIPRYINLYSELINENESEEILELSRNELIELFIKKKLKTIEGNGIYMHYKMQILEKIALIMEIGQLNYINKEDLVSVLIEIGVQPSYSKEFNLEFIYKDELIIKDHVEFLEFENTEFQECLAAKAITRLGRINQVVFDIAIVEEVNWFPPEWVDVFTFLCENTKMKRNPIAIDFCNHAIKSNQVELFDLLQYSSSTLNKQIRLGLFESILYYAIDKRIWHSFNDNIYYTLSLFFDEDRHHKFLTDLFRNRRFKNIESEAYYYLAGNVCLLFYELKKHYKFKDYYKKYYWKEKFKSIVELPLYFGDLPQRHAVDSISYLGGYKDLIQIKEQLGKKGNSFNSAYIRALSEESPNNIESIKLYFKYTSLKNFSVFSPYNSINSKEGVLNLFIVLQDHLDNKQNMRRDDFDECLDDLNSNHSKFIGFIETIWDDKIEHASIKLVYSSCMKSSYHYLKDNKFYVKIIDKLKDSKNRDLHFEYILNQLKGKKLTFKDNFREINSISRLISNFLDFNNLPEQLKKLDKVFKHFSLGYQVLSRMPFPDNRRMLIKHYNQIWTETKKKYEENENEEKKYREEQETRKSERIDEFFSYLNQNYIGAIVLFFRYKDDVIGLLQDSDVQKLKRIVEGILSDFLRHKNIRYTTTAMQLADEFKFDISKYRDKLIYLIACTGHKDHYERFSPYSNHEVEELFQWAKKESVTHIFNFLKQFKSYSELIKTESLLNWILDDEVEQYLKYQAIDILSDVRQDSKALLKLWNRMKETSLTKEEELLYTNITYALVGLQNSAATKESFEDILNSAYSTKPIPNKEGVMSALHPNHGKGRIIEKISDPNLLPHIVKLLESSFNKLANDHTLYDYIEQEIWSNCISSIINLKSNDFLAFETTVKTINQIYYSHKGLNKLQWFEVKLNRLKREYSLELLLNDSTFDLIRKYNHVKSKKYKTIYNEYDLYRNLIKKIDIDLRYWVGDGYYKVIRQSSGHQENLIQKTLVTQLENILLKEGYRNSDFAYLDIQRESNTISDKRIDVLVSYGGIGPVLIEIKRASSSEFSGIGYIKYKKKLQAYMRQFNAKYLIYLIFEDRNEEKISLKFKDQLSKVTSEYKSIFGLETIGIDCTVSNWSQN